MKEDSSNKEEGGASAWQLLETRWNQNRG